MCVSVNEQLVT